MPDGDQTPANATQHGQRPTRRSTPPFIVEIPAFVEHPSRYYSRGQIDHVSHMFHDNVTVVDYRYEMVFRVAAAHRGLAAGRRER